MIYTITFSRAGSPNVKETVRGLTDKVAVLKRFEELVTAGCNVRLVARPAKA